PSPTLFRSHPLQRHGRGGVAGENDEVAALVPEPLHPRAGEREDVLGVAHPIGRVRVVAEIDEGHFGHRTRHGLVDREPAETRIENADSHPRLLPRVPWHEAPQARYFSSNSRPYS